MNGKELPVFVNSRSSNGQVATVLDPATGKIYRVGRDLTLRGEVAKDPNHYELLPDGRFRQVDANGRPVAGGLEAYYAPLGSYRVVNGERRPIVRQWQREEPAVARSTAGERVPVESGLDVAAATKSGVFREAWNKARNMMKGLGNRLNITAETERELFFVIEQAEKEGRLIEYLRSRLFDMDEFYQALTTCRVPVRVTASLGDIDDLFPQLVKPNPATLVCWR